MMDFLADIFLGAGALAAAIYCLVLSRRLSRLKGLDQDIGGAIAVLSQQVDEMTKVLVSAQETATTSSTSLENTTEQALKVADRLEVMMAALDDHPDEAPEPVIEASQSDETEDTPEFDTQNVSMFVRNRASLSEAGG
jgi:hypothetical protein